MLLLFLPPFAVPFLPIFLQALSINNPIFKHIYPTSVIYLKSWPRKDFQLFIILIQLTPDILFRHVFWKLI